MRGQENRSKFLHVYMTDSLIPIYNRLNFDQQRQAKSNKNLKNCAVSLQNVVEYGKYSLAKFAFIYINLHVIFVLRGKSSPISASYIRLYIPLHVCFPTLITPLACSFWVLPFRTLAAGKNVT